MDGVAARWNYHGTNHFRAERDRFLQSRKSGSDVVRLHLGCGSKILRGWVNVDNRGEPDLNADITDLPYLENSVEEIMAIHVFEHLYPWKVEEILKGWRKILKPGGKLILEMPDLKKVLKHFQDPKAHPSLTMLALYGGEATDRIEELHKWCWDMEQIEPMLKQAGFTKVEEKPPQYHIPIRDFRVEATK